MTLAYCIQVMGHICSEFHQSWYHLDKHNRGVVQQLGNKFYLVYYRLADAPEEVNVLNTLALQLCNFLLLLTGNKCVFASVISVHTQLCTYDVLSYRL